MTDKLFAISMGIYGFSWALTMFYLYSVGSRHPRLTLALANAGALVMLIGAIWLVSL